MNRATLRSGFTLRELAVVVAVLALLLTVSLPGCGNSRDTTAARNACRNQMKVQVLALLNHNDAYKKFPPLFFSHNPEWSIKLSPAEAAECYPWQVRLLPFVEQGSLFKHITEASEKYMLPASQVKLRSQDGQDLAPASFELQHLLCPAVPDPIAAGTSHYVALSATRLPLLLETHIDATAQHAFKRSPDGMIIPDVNAAGQSMSRMSDGTSKTAVLTESRESARSNWYQPQQSFVVGVLPEDSTAVPDTTPTNYYPYYGKEGWIPNPKIDRTALNAGPTSGEPSLAYHRAKDDPLARTWGPSSAHSGGVVIHGMGDGSVVEVKSDIDPKVYFATITCRGGENVPSLNN